MTQDPLLVEGRDYAFFQALRLLRLRFPTDEAFSDGVRIRPSLGLGFPECDILGIDHDESGRYHLQASFFGLYGVTSPLPTFYTEDLIDEQLQGRGAGRDFLDILHAALYPLLFRAWEKNRLWMTIGERNDLNPLNLMHSLIGLADARPQLRQHATQLLRYAGIFNQFPRSALGLEQLISSQLEGDRVNIVPCVQTQVPIDDQARCRLGIQGNVLGQNSLLGQQVSDRTSTLEIRIGPLDASRFHLMIPGASLYKRIEQLIVLYLQTPVKCRLELSLKTEQQRGMSLADGWQQLGTNTWLGQTVEHAKAVFTLSGTQISGAQSRTEQ